MLGDMQQSWCPSCAARPGPDCYDTGKGTRARKRIERRALGPDIADAIEVAAEERIEYLMRKALPLWREDCRHGCNGDCLEWGSPRCDFTCHEPVIAERAQAACT